MKNTIYLWKNKILSTLTCLTAVSALPSFADVRLPKLVGHNMVIQRDIKIPIWGWADKGEAVSVDIQGTLFKTKADKSGKWKIMFGPFKVGKPFEITIEGKNTIVIKNVLVGDVWVCSGQSNMEWNVLDSDNAKAEIFNAQFPNIRLFKLPKVVSTLPLEEIENSNESFEAKWLVCSPKTIKEFSAVGYFFGRSLHTEIDIPIGLIQSAWGGTEIESWTSKEGLKTEPTFGNEANNIVPKLNWEQKRKEHEIEYEKFKNSLKTNDKGINGEEYAWASPSTDYSTWSEVSVPVKFEYSRVKDLENNATGPVWMYKSFILTEEQAHKDLIVSLGKIEDEDQTFINGKLVGETKKEWLNRSYTVSSTNLKSGKNTIVVRVTDYMWVGGMTASPDDLYLQSGDDIMGLSGTWKFKIGHQVPQDKTPSEWFGPNDYTTVTYNGMIAPLLNYPIKGAIWYQGENNARRPFQYRDLLPRMINDWRSKWSIGPFPFLIVQLANFSSVSEKPAESEWAELREAQFMALSLTNTGIANAIDLGGDDIHPKNKQDVGIRLAKLALKNVYGKNIVAYGPTYKTMELVGASILVTFDNVANGLLIKDRFQYIKGFQIAGPDKKFYWAKAEKIKGNTVRVYASEVVEPVAVRYSWETNPFDSNLYNSEGLPAFPFRTDDWKSGTEVKK